ncbi:unnamed protein product [Miscanthus lutarioriparius]|uniref:Response regulatory domain-containing protein n=1 Tax=Miscanthus lutarioriparius TaxID=422564 RepID=A0A811S6Q3_9POAL|nr:unnamed protein product [Miscanthus lutarioriparius]
MAGESTSREAPPSGPAAKTGEEMDADTFPAGLRVLAVEHHRVCCKLLERQLKYCNYNATMVTNGQTALDMLRERKDGNQFDLVISNVAMPKPNMDGFKLLELIGLEMDLPVISKALAQTHFSIFMHDILLIVQTIAIMRICSTTIFGCCPG